MKRSATSEIKILIKHFNGNETCSEKGQEPLSENSTNQQQMKATDECAANLNTSENKTTDTATAFKDDRWGCYTKESKTSLKEFLKCWSCRHHYNSTNRQQKTTDCGHTCCDDCIKSNKHLPCNLCFSIFLNDTKQIRDSDMNTKWLFDDIENSCDEFMNENKRYAHYDQVVECLRKTFKLEAFYKTQYSAINAVMLGKNCFILMPSGGGKSLIYQLPACCCNEITVVICPLISLIHDQVNQLKKNGVRAEHLIGTQAQNNKVFSSLNQKVPLVRLLYLTPERFKHASIQKQLILLHQNNLIKRFVFDEAHCITLWGKDFRKAYLSIKGPLNLLFKNVPVLLLTASATSQERRDIVSTLGLRPDRDIKYFLYSFNRPNLQYEVECINMQKKFEKVLEICLNDRFSRSTGIVYCISKVDCDLMARFLCSNNVKAKTYHAGMKDTTRLHVQNEWMNDSADCRVIVATIAFGMGINKPDVKFVIHCGLPKSLEGYYQESGRAGRNHQYSLCKLFWTPQDSNLWIETLTEARNKKASSSDCSESDDKLLEKQIAALNSMEQYAKQIKECRRKFMLNYFGQDYDPINCIYNITSVCDNCLRNLN